jgi:hypothetical protein
MAFRRLLCIAWAVLSYWLSAEPQQLACSVALKWTHNSQRIHTVGGHPNNTVQQQNGKKIQGARGEGRDCAIGWTGVS